MKKIVCLILISLLLLSVVGCGNTSNGSKSPQNKSKSVNDVLNEQIGKESQADNQNSNENNAETKKESEKANSTAVDSSEIDVDLTTLNSTMVYSEVYNMMQTPENYRGKTIKMDGQFSIYHDDSTGMNYYACVIADATACCQQGLEFVLAGDYKYPDDYPKLGTEISVVGEFQTYMEGQTQYCHLVNAKFLK